MNIIDVKRAQDGVIVHLNADMIAWIEPYGSSQCLVIMSAANSPHPGAPIVVNELPSTLASRLRAK